MVLFARYLSCFSRMLHKKKPHCFNQSLFDELPSDCMWLLTFHYLQSYTASFLYTNYIVIIILSSIKPIKTVMYITDLPKLFFPPLLAQILNLAP